MAHFSLVFCKASDSLSYHGLQQMSQKIEEHGLEGLKLRPLAKQSRLSRPNTSQEIRKKKVTEGEEKDKKKESCQRNR